MRLSPDGKRLLYIRTTRVDVDGRNRRKCQLILREVASGKDTVLPIPAMMWDDPLVAMLSMNPFNADGSKIVLGAGIDENGNGWKDRRGEKAQLVVYDIPTGKLAKLPVISGEVFPTFDRTGKRVIVATWDRGPMSGKLYAIAPAKDAQPKEFKQWGFPRSLCPTADLLPMLLPPSEESSKGGGFALYDLAKDEQVAKLPGHAKNTKLDDYNPQWTPDGRYLCYVDVKIESSDGREQRKYVTRVWDRVGKKEKAILDAFIPIGPGPAPTAVILTNPYEGTKTLRPILYDVASDKFWPIGDESMSVIAAQGKWLIYRRSGDGGKAPGAYVAEVVPPAELKVKPKAAKK